MNMKTFFTALLMAFFFFPTGTVSQANTAKGKAILSFALPSKLDWTQLTNEELANDMKVFTLGEDKLIRLSSVQVGNDKMWAQFASMDKEKIYIELVEGKKIVHDMMGYKNWKADKSIQKKSDKEIIFEINGSFEEETMKKYFVEKYYLTPFGFILISLDWTEKAETQLAKKAQDEFKNISFKSEIQ